MLLLAILAPLVAEVLSGATPVTQFFLPGVFFPYVIFLYGLQVLTVRELAVRYGLGLTGLWCLGMVYGLYNEGLLTESLYHPLPVSIDAFADYGVVQGLRIPWMLFILPWHGFFSVVLPVLLVERAFPAQAGRPWLPRWAAWTLGVLCAGFGIVRFAFFGEDLVVQDRPDFLLHVGVVVALGVALYVLARTALRTSHSIVDSQEPVRLRWRPFIAGMLAFAALLAGEALVEANIPVLLVYSYFTIALGFGGWLLARRRRIGRADALAFGCGTGLAQSSLAVVVGTLGNPIWAAAGVLAATGFIVLWRRSR